MLPFKDIAKRLKSPPSERTIRNELSRLREQGLVDVSGHGRGATWFFKPNKAK